MPTRPSLTTALSLALLLCACEAQPDVPLVDECSIEIRIPTGFVGGVGELAPLHEDVYGAAPAPYQVRYQWPGRDPSASAAFVWRTDLETLATVVEYGVGEALDQRVEGATFGFDQAADGTGGERMHEVRICGGLEPDTSYSYRVGGDEAWSPVYRFTTPPPPRSFDVVRVAVAGDSRGAYTTWASIVQAMEEHDPDLFVFTGDMIELGTDQGQWDAWFEAWGDLLTRKGLVVTHGNHEFLARNYFAQFALPGNEEWFTIDYGPLQITSLNDTVRSMSEIETLQPMYLESVLQDSDATWRLVTSHQSAWSACTVHGSDPWVRENWSGVMETGGVDLVFNGHNHIYERSVPILNGVEAAPGQGTVYLVSGGGGAPLYSNVDDLWFNEVAASVEHYLIADFGPDEVHVVARDLAGNVIDDFTLPSRR